MEEELKVMPFDGERAAALVVELRGTFRTGRTMSYDWRAAQLRAIVKMIDDKEADITAALDDDLSKPQLESFLHEVDALKDTLEKFYGKDPLESKDLSRIVNYNHFTRVARLLDDDKVSGKIVYGGQRDEKSLRIAPTILLDLPQDAVMMNEEIFGPLLPIVLVNTVEESIDVINSRTKPLAAYLFTKDKKLEKKFVRTVSSDGMLINDTTLHVVNPNLPFGGVGESGTGSYHGKFSFDAFSHKKAVVSRGFGGEAPARYPPYTPQKQKVLRALLAGNIIAIFLALIGWPRG